MIFLPGTLLPVYDFLELDASWEHTGNYYVYVPAAYCTTGIFHANVHRPQCVEKTRLSELSKHMNAKPKVHSPVPAVPVSWPRWSGWLCGGAWRSSLGCSVPLRTAKLSAGRGRSHGVGSESPEARTEAGRDPHPARTLNPGRPEPAKGLAESFESRAWRRSWCAAWTKGQESSCSWNYREECLLTQNTNRYDSLSWGSAAVLLPNKCSSGGRSQMLEAAVCVQETKRVHVLNRFPINCTNLHIHISRDTKFETTNNIWFQDYINDIKNVSTSLILCIQFNLLELTTGVSISLLLFSYSVALTNKNNKLFKETNEQK